MSKIVKSFPVKILISEVTKLNNEDSFILKKSNN